MLTVTVERCFSRGQNQRELLCETGAPGQRMRRLAVFGQRRLADFLQGRREDFEFSRLRRETPVPGFLVYGLQRDPDAAWLAPAALRCHPTGCPGKAPRQRP